MADWPGRLGAALLDLLFPPKCVFCGGLLSRGEEGLCNCCQTALPWTDPDGPPKRCDGVEQCLSPLWYQDQVRRSFHRYKFSGRRGYAPIYGLLMAQCVQDRLTAPFDCITWVPLSKKRLRKRGYDQALLLAQAMSGHLDAAVIPTLKKLRNTRAQSSLAEEDRRRDNVKAAYAVLDPAAVTGRRILLVDDVVTTGSTLSECARALREAGAAGVSAVTLARARR